MPKEKINEYHQYPYASPITGISASHPPTETIKNDNNNNSATNQNDNLNHKLA